MWTYLLILLSAVVLVAVFVRRYIILKKGGEKVEEEMGESIEESFKTRPLKMAKEDSSKIDSLFIKGEALLKSGKDDEAIKCFVQVLAIDPHHEETQRALAMLYLQKQMYSAASALFRQLCDGKADPVHYSHLGYALFQQSDFESAKKAYQEAIKLDDSRPQRFVSLSQVYRSLGLINNAIIALNKALEIDMQNMDFLFLMSGLKSDLGDNAGAVEVLKQILELDAENTEAKELLKVLETKEQDPAL